MIRSQHWHFLCYPGFVWSVIFFIFPMENPPWLGNRLSEYVLFFGHPESANPSYGSLRSLVPWVVWGFIVWLIVAWTIYGEITSFEHTWLISTTIFTINYLIYVLWWNYLVMMSHTFVHRLFSTTRQVQSMAISGTDWMEVPTIYVWPVC